MRFLKLLLCAGCLLGAHTVCAQEDGRQALSLQWGVYIPSQGGFLNRTTAISPALGWTWQLNDAFSVGAELGLTRGAECEDTRDLYEGDVITGFTDRTLTLIPVTANFRWFPGTNAQQLLRPFIGVAAGVQYAGFHITGDQVNTSSGRTWGAVVRPELGVRYTPRHNHRLCIEVGCSWQYASNQWQVLDVKSLQGVRISAGVNYRFNATRK